MDLFLKHLKDKINYSYEPYEKRIEKNILLSLLTLTMKDEERNDLSNNLEYIFIVSEINEYIFNDNLDYLKYQANLNDETAKLILFVGELYVKLYNSPILIKSVIISNTCIIIKIFNVKFVLLTWTK